MWSYASLKVSLGLPRCTRANQSGRSAAWLARLVRDQEVDGSNPFAPTIISPLDSILYAALSTATSGRDLGTTGTAEGFFVGNVKPSPTLSATSFLYSTSSRSFEYPSVTVS